jgi:spore maturation protein CgeB
MQEEEFSDLIDFDADINIFFRGEFIPRTILMKLRGVKVALSSEPFPRYVGSRLHYTRDSMFRYIVFRAIKDLPFDYVFHYDEASLPFLEEDGLCLSGCFPFPVATRIYRPIPAAPEWDFFFIGRSTPHRERYFEHLKHYYHFLHICHGMWGRSLVEYISKSRIAFNIHAEDEVSWEPRVQMLLSCGAFLISEKLSQNSILRPGQDYVEVCTPAQAHQAAEYYLKHDSERLRVASTGHARVIEHLSAERNFADLISNIFNGKYKRFAVGDGAAGLKIRRTAWYIQEGFRRLVS